jgi:hypothetical protein
MSKEEMVADSESVRELAEECPREAAIIMEMLTASEAESEE